MSTSKSAHVQVVTLAEELRQLLAVIEINAGEMRVRMAQTGA